MFDRIAPRYDLLNRVLSMRRDVVWRRRVAALLPERESLEVLDLATGTGDVLIALHGANPRVESGVGLDMSGGMLALGQEKLEERGLGSRFRMVRGDAMSIALGDDTFDAITIAFGIRNVMNVETALREMLRTLRPGGRVLILEFSLPTNWFIRVVYLLYFRHILPFLGGIVSGDRAAYQYLNKSVESFPYGEDFTALMHDVGFADVKAYPQSFGIATIYLGDKPETVS